MCMQPLNAWELLTVWDENSHKPLLSKTLGLLAKACGTDDTVKIGRMSIGERDARLLMLREWLFGTAMKNKTACPVCKENVEWEASTRQMLVQHLRTDFSVPVFTAETTSATIFFRLPDSFDLQKAGEQQDNGNGIIENCILEIMRNGEKHPAASIAPAELEALEKRMSEEDPQADIRVQLNCPACANAWEAAFDIMSYLWAEINNWAYRLMDEVALLARHFGWAEKDIVNMSARKRNLYIQMLYT